MRPYSQTAAASASERGQRIAIVLPPKERFAADQAGAVSLCVRDAARASRLRDRLLVLGLPVATPFEDVAFEGVTPGMWRLAGRNRGFGLAAARHLARSDIGLVEVHNRPQMALLLRRFSGNRKVALHLHNDPLSMAGLRLAEARRHVLDRLDGVICVSSFVRKRFLEDIDDPRGKLRVLYNGIARTQVDVDAKTPTILFAGRMTPDKGVQHLLDALAQLLPTRPAWRCELLGATWYGGTRQPSPFEREIAARVVALESQVEAKGFVSNDEVLQAMRLASIVVVPSLIPEAFNRTAVEALAQNCAVVAYPQGGLKEVLEGRGVLVEPSTPGALAQALAPLMDDAIALRSVQERATTNFPFDIGPLAEQQDAWREELIGTSARFEMG